MQNVTSFSNDTIPLTDEDFLFFKKLAEDVIGIHLKDVKRQLVYTRVSKRVRHLGMSSFKEYRNYLLEQNNENEIIELINTLTTNTTSFFREKHHFDFLYDKAIQDRMSKKKSGDNFMVWSAGCSTGEEPYTIAMVLHRWFKRHNANNIKPKVLATDIDTNVLSRAKSACYGPDHIQQNTPQDYYDEYFHLQDDHYEISSEATSLVHFRRLNLMESWPMKKPYDIIFCRNVMIYFSKDTQHKLMLKFAEKMAIGGYLCIGHSEVLQQYENYFRPCGRTIYQRID